MQTRQEKGFNHGSRETNYNHVLRHVLPLPDASFGHGVELDIPSFDRESGLMGRLNGPNSREIPDSLRQYRVHFCVLEFREVYDRLLQDVSPKGIMHGRRDGIRHSRVPMYSPHGLNTRRLQQVEVGEDSCEQAPIRLGVGVD